MPFMREESRTVCPIPYLGYCVYERCNFWDEAAQECSGLCFDEYTPLEDQGLSAVDGACTVYWTEDTD
jgi:hypothetical protein